MGNLENNGMEEICLVTPTRDQLKLIYVNDGNILLTWHFCQRNFMP